MKRHNGRGTKKRDRAHAFAIEYAVDFNATRAALAVGYSEGCAQNVGCSMLKDPEVKKMVNAELARHGESVRVSARRVLRELEVLGYSDVNHYEVDADTGKVTLAEGAPRSAKRAIKAIEYDVTYSNKGDRYVKTKIKLWDKPTALTNLGKKLGLYLERHEHAGPGGKPIETKQGLSDELAEFLRRDVLGVK